MALTRAQLLMGDGGQGIVLSNQAQGVRPGGGGITIRGDGVIEVNSQTVIGLMKLGQTTAAAANAFNGYTWPLGAGNNRQQLTTDGLGGLSWEDSDHIPWSAKGQLVVGTGVETDILFNVGSNRSFIVADSSTLSGLNYTDAIQTSVIIPSGQETQRPSGPVAGDFRLNTDEGKLEFYTGTGWEEVASGDPAVNGFVKQTIPTAGNPSAVIPTGSTTDRQTAPAPADGYLRFNTTTGQLEVWDTSAWEAIPSSATGTFVEQSIPTAGTASAIIPPGPTGAEQTAPAPLGGYLRYNTTENYLEFFNGATWELVAPSAGSVHSFVQAATPAAFNPGDIWYNTTLQRESVWDGSAWVQPGVTQTGPTGAALLPVGTTGQQPAGVAGMIRYNSSIDNIEFWDAANSVWGTAGGFTSGTRLAFVQAAAPIGWVKETGAAYNNAALRFVTGATGNSTGGVNPFTSVFTSYTPSGSVAASTANTTAGGTVSSTADNTTAGGSVSGSVDGTVLSTAQLAAHTHPNLYGNGFWVDSPAAFVANGGGSNINFGNASTTASTGSNTSHTHTLTAATFAGTPHTHTVTSTFSGIAHDHTVTATFTGVATNQFDVKYVDSIICTKV